MFSARSAFAFLFDVALSLQNPPVMFGQLRKSSSNPQRNILQLIFLSYYVFTRIFHLTGKSTFLRQNALIAILAQAGSFVPAQSATIGKIYTVRWK